MPAPAATSDGRRHDAGRTNQSGTADVNVLAGAFDCNERWHGASAHC